MSANITRRPITQTPQTYSKTDRVGIEEFIMQFLEHMEVERGASPYTIRNYHFYLKRFSHWFIQHHHDDDIQSLSVALVRKYRLYLSRLQGDAERNLSKSTQAYHVIALRSFLKWLVKIDVEVIAPEKIDLPKIESRRIEFLVKEDVDRLLSQPTISTAVGLRDKALLELLFSTGLRVSELVGLNRDQVNIDRREFGVTGKGGVTRVVFLSKRSAQWLERYLQKREDHWKPIFVRYSRGTADPTTDGEQMRLTARSVQRVVEKYRRKAKLPIKITPHGLRHSFATDLLHSGAGLREVQEMLGHKNVSTTQIYTHVTNPQLRKVHEKYHSGNQ